MSCYHLTVELVTAAIRANTRDVTKMLLSTKNSDNAKKMRLFNSNQIKKNLFLLLGTILIQLFTKNFI